MPLSDIQVYLLVDHQTVNSDVTTKLWPDFKGEAWADFKISWVGALCKGACGMRDQKPICCPLPFYLRQQVSALTCQIVPMETVCSVYEESGAYLCRTCLHCCLRNAVVVCSYSIWSLFWLNTLPHEDIVYDLHSDLLVCVLTTRTILAHSSVCEPILTRNRK